MSTLIRILIKDVDKEDLIEEVKDYYKTGRSKQYDYEYYEAFLDQGNYVIIIFDAYIEGWTEIGLNSYTSLDEFDDFLSKISKKYQTSVLLGIEQNSTGDSRLLILKNGKTARSIRFKFSDNTKEITLEDNFGTRLASEKSYQYPALGQITSGYNYLSMHEIQQIFTDAGYIGNPRPILSGKYIHLESNREKKGN